MSQYKLAYKHKNLTTNKWPVRLEEYMIFEDEANSNKCLVLKLKNQSFHKLNKVMFEIKQFNEDLELISKADYQYENLTIQPDHYFLPPEKIKLSKMCDRVQYTLLQTENTEKRWFDNQWLNINQLEANQDLVLSTQKVTMIKLKNLSLPYFLTLISFIVFVLLVIFVFNTLNPTFSY